MSTVWIQPSLDVLRASRWRILTAVLGVALCGCILLVSEPVVAQQAVRYFGYYFTLAASLGFLFYAVQLLRAVDWRGLKRSACWAGLGSVLLGCWLLFAQADFGYKIAMDEYLLTQTARGMHETREVARTEYGRQVGRSYSTITTEVDKRPWFYPFVVASLHDLVGYRSVNPFIVNVAAALLFLSGAYYFGYLLAGAWAGLSSVLLWVGLPLLAQNATGAGMELLNLCLLQWLLILAARYVQSPSAGAEGALSLVAVLLAYTRYESGLFILPVALVIVLGWVRSGRIILSWGTISAAPLLLGLALQTQVYAVSESSWEVAVAGTAPFGLDALLGNIPHALYFFFSYDHDLANSLLLSVLGIPAVLAFYVMLRTEFPKYWRNNPAGVVASLFGLFFGLHFLLVLSFHASQLDRPYVSRYALPVHWIFVVALVALTAYIAEKRPVAWRYLIGAAAIFILGFTLPINAKAIFSRSSFIVNERSWLEDLSAGQMESDSLVVDRFYPSWTLLQRAALAPQIALQYAERIEAEVRQGKYPAVYLVERMHYRAGRFVPNLPEFEALRAEWQVELFRERSFSPFELTRVYRYMPGAPEPELEPLEWPDGVN
jgi:hypothetical protein